MDRVTVRQRPTGRAPQGFQRWRELLFVHWSVDEAALRRVVPTGLDLDTFGGQHYVGVVLFAMEGVRPRWVPDALSFDFLETNVRCYVHRAGRDPGVYFLSLDAASWIAVHAARMAWSLPYHFANIACRHDPSGVRYSLERRDAEAPSVTARWRVDGDPTAGEAAKVGSIEDFLVERYLLYVPRRGGLWVGQVHHRPYPLVSVTDVAVDESLIAAAGVARPSGPPPLTHYSPGVDVEIFGLERVGRGG